MPMCQHARAAIARRPRAMAMPATVVFLLQPSSAVASVETCVKPTGGFIRIAYSACVDDTDHCFNWMNATCVDGRRCKCDDSQCVIGRQCVDKGRCPSATGGLCSILDCDRWRNAYCSESRVDNHEANCLCRPGTCPIKGECRPPGVCAKDTGGTCNVRGCNAWRQAGCSVPQGLPRPGERAKCMCGEGACPINGECVPDAGCPRYTGHGCKLLGIPLPCAAGTCSTAGYCECPEDQCFVDGFCVPRSPEAIRRSREWGATQEAAAKMATKWSFGAAWTPALAFSGALFAACGLGYVWRPAALWRAPIRADAYQNLEG